MGGQARREGGRADVSAHRHSVVSVVVLIQTGQRWSSRDLQKGPLPSRRTGEEGDPCLERLLCVCLAAGWISTLGCSLRQWQHSWAARTSLAPSLDCLTPRCEPRMARNSDQFLVSAQMTRRPLSLNQIPSQTLASAAPASTVAS